MNDQPITTVVDQATNTVAQEPVVGGVPPQVINGAPAQAQAAPIYQQAVPQEEPKKKMSIKDFFLFAQNNIFTRKVCNITLISLGGLITALCVLQMIFWGFAVKADFSDFSDAIKTPDYINIGIMAIMALFSVVLLVNTVKSIVFMIKKEHEPRFEMVSTLFAFYVFFLFAKKVFQGTSLLITKFDFSPLIEIIISLVVVYAIIRLFVEDFGSRICPFAFSCGAIVLVAIMYSQDIGNFATFSVGGIWNFELSDLNLYQYLQAAMGENTTATLESVYLDCGCAMDFGGLDERVAAIFLQVFQMAVSTILPMIALSLLGYLLYGLVGRSHMQYYNLQACKKVSITMLVASIFSIAATVGLYFICKASKIPFAVEINYGNIVTTVLLCIFMIVVTSLPWSIYKMLYRHHYAVYQKSEGGN